MYSVQMEATIDIEFLQGVNKLVIKELAVVSDGVLQMLSIIWSLTVSE